MAKLAHPRRRRLTQSATSSARTAAANTAKSLTLLCND